MRENPFNGFPTSVDVDGQLFPINPSFRVGISIELEILKEENPDVVGLLNLFYPSGIPSNISAAFDAMLWFFRGEESKEETQEQAKKKGGRVYDFEIDSEAILASFLSAYGIDLSKDDLHWWAFRRLLFNLPSETLFMQRIRYRTADISKMSKEEKKHYKKMRALYAIKADRRREVQTVEERDAALIEKVRKRFEEAKRSTEKT